MRDGKVSMGTVGLSFGSATSGQGFDVASTVTQIQASEQAIETPWQNQLTALQAQDTVLLDFGERSFHFDDEPAGFDRLRWGVLREAGIELESGCVESYVGKHDGDRPEAIRL